MSSAKEEILARVRSAIADIPAGSVEERAPIDWEYARGMEIDGDLVNVFAERVEDYRAVVVRCGENEIEDKIGEAVKHHNASSLLIPPGLEDSWSAAAEGAGTRLVTEEDGQLSAKELNVVDGVLTASAVGIADTGTIVLDHGAGQGRRALSLVPDLHICVVRADQVVTNVPQAIARLGDAVRAGQPLTWISGPSATSDIELSRVEGVHGPRTLHVIIAG
ncbi:MAG: lactate utilization protein C [Flaviflexus sp.]|nr:lactate utilization protein C [Flaviflexus sp.]